MEDEEGISAGEAAAAEKVRADTWRDVRQAALELSGVVQVATAQLKEVSATGVLLHHFHTQPARDARAQETLERLTEEVGILTEEVQALRKVVADLQQTCEAGASARGSGSAAGGSRGRGSRRGGGGRRARGGAAQQDDLEMLDRGDEESELSDIPSDLSDKEL